MGSLPFRFEQYLFFPVTPQGAGLWSDGGTAVNRRKDSELTSSDNRGKKGVFLYILLLTIFIFAVFESWVTWLWSPVFTCCISLLRWLQLLTVLVLSVPTEFSLQLKTNTRCGFWQSGLCWLALDSSLFSYHEWQTQRARTDAKHMRRVFTASPSLQYRCIICHDILIKYYSWLVLRRLNEVPLELSGKCDLGVSKERRGFIWVSVHSKLII